MSEFLFYSASATEVRRVEIVNSKENLAAAQKNLEKKTAHKNDVMSLPGLKSRSVMIPWAIFSAKQHHFQLDTRIC